MDSIYFDTAKIAELVADGKHRELVGGAWEEIGRLQFTFLVAKGLQPHHKMVDIGCGSLRGGIHFVAYLAKGNYFGVDINQALLDSGREEIKHAGLTDRLPVENLSCSKDFELALFGEAFDFAIAQSLFTHLSLNRIRRCLEEVSDVLKEGGVLYATFFERPDRTPARTGRTHEPTGIQTHDVQDPYHYSVDDFRYLARNLPLELEYIGDWSHPRGQKILALHRKSRPLR